MGRTVAQPAAPPRVPGRNARIAARDKRGPQTLEETLEILGASGLEIEEARGETINDSGVRHLRVEVSGHGYRFDEWLDGAKLPLRNISPRCSKFDRTGVDP